VPFGAGVSILLAFAILAVVGTVDRFPDAASLGNYTGNVPTVKASGSKSWSGGITRNGPNLLRWALTEAVYGLTRGDGYFRNMYRRIKGKNPKRHGVAVTACARELAQVIWKMLKTGQPFEACVPRSSPPSEKQAERRDKQQQRKQKRQRLALQAAQREVQKQPPAMEVIRGHLAVLKELARVPDSSTPMPAAFATSGSSPQAVSKGHVAA
jgi:hypothetical protein